MHWTTCCSTLKTLQWPSPCLHCLLSRPRRWVSIPLLSPDQNPHGRTFFWETNTRSKGWLVRGTNFRSTRLWKLSHYIWSSAKSNVWLCKYTKKPQRAVTFSNGCSFWCFLGKEMHKLAHFIVMTVLVVFNIRHWSMWLYVVIIYWIDNEFCCGLYYICFLRNILL